MGYPQQVRPTIRKCVLQRPQVALRCTSGPGSGHLEGSTIDFEAVCAREMGMLRRKRTASDHELPSRRLSADPNVHLFTRSAHYSDHCYELPTIGTGFIVHIGESLQGKERPLPCRKPLAMTVGPYQSREWRQVYRPCSNVERTSPAVRRSVSEVDP